MQKLLVIVPCRAGSLGVHRKNVRSVAGVPLIAWAIEKLLVVAEAVEELDVEISILVVTNDPEVAARTQLWSQTGAPIAVLERPLSQAMANQTLDELVRWVMEQGRDDYWDMVAVHQVTSPTLRAQTITDMIQWFVENDHIDSAMTMVADTSHTWTEDGPHPMRRVNRQFLYESELRFRESGGLQICRDWPHQDGYYGDAVWMIGDAHDPYVIPNEEGLDIDTPADMAAAELVLERSSIAIVCAGDHDMGSGHVRRGAEIASALSPFAEVDVYFWDTPPDMRKLVPGIWRHGNLTAEELSMLWANFDTVVLDTLDTTDTRDITAKWPRKTVRLESLMVDANTQPINGLYTFPIGTSGPLWIDVRDEFKYLPPYPIREKLGRILVLFGGTDAANMTPGVCNALMAAKTLNDVSVVAVIGPGSDVKRSELHPRVEVLEDPSISYEMWNSDVVITGRGRTAYEAAHVGVPTVSIPVNIREANENQAPPGALTETRSLTYMDCVAKLIPVSARLEASTLLQEGVDGHGLDRIRDEILKTAKEQRRRRPPVEFEVT